jgi:hypothetical protein
VLYFFETVAGVFRDELGIEHIGAAAIFLIGAGLALALIVRTVHSLILSSVSRWHIARCTSALGIWQLEAFENHRYNSALR